MGRALVFSSRMYVSESGQRAIENRGRLTVFRLLAAVLITALVWLSGPHMALAAVQRPKPKLYSAMKPGLTQTPDADLLKKIEVREAAERNKPHPVIRALTSKEVKTLTGRGPQTTPTPFAHPFDPGNNSRSFPGGAITGHYIPGAVPTSTPPARYRNPYLGGAPMPWHRSLRDVNLCTGNLFKSFTDFQIAPAHGAGLVLQRTYSSQDWNEGAFGTGWTHAYDIRMNETAEVDSSGDEVSVRTDFFGGKHKYYRDADGLYSPPAYLYDEPDSNYNVYLTNGPPKVALDIEKGQDGTVKHFIPGGTDVSGQPSSERVCDYIQDRHGNTTTLTYGLTINLYNGGFPAQPHATKKLLTQVTDPSGRSLTFSWINLGTSEDPHGCDSRSGHLRGNRQFTRATDNSESQTYSFDAMGTA